MKRALLILSVFCLGSIYAQTSKSHLAKLVTEFEKQATLIPIDILAESDNRSAFTFPPELINYEIFSIDTEVLEEVRQSSPQGIIIPLRLSAEVLELKLVQVQVLSDDFSITEQPSGIEHVMDLGLHFRGVVNGIEGSIVAISINENEISGIVSIPDRLGNLVLGRIENSIEHILYMDDDIKDEFDFVCGAEPFDSDEILPMETANRFSTRCPEIHIDLGKDVHDNKGGVLNATNYVTALFNQIAILYDNRNIDILLAGVTVWSDQEPFAGLDSYRGYRENNSVGGDLNAYVNYAYSGGVAYLSGLCNSYKYSVSGINSSFNNIPTYSWSVMVLAHELGHNMGSPHTHACAWNGNNTAIDGCGPNAGYNEGCAGINPPEGGNVMSYCHLTSVGINFSVGFGLQPATRIRNYIDGSSCVDNCGVPATCDDGIQNGQETGIDCGGPDCTECQPCPGTKIFLPTGTSGPALVLCVSGPIPVGYTAALYQGCAQQILSDDALCLDVIWGALCQDQYDICTSLLDCSVFESAPSSLTKSFDPIGGVEDRVQVKFFKNSPDVAYSSEDSAACDILFWPKRYIDPESGQIYGDPILDPDSTLLFQVQKANNNPLFKWPIKYRADGANNLKRVESNLRYEWKVRCYCQKGQGLVSPWSATKTFNTPNFDSSLGINTGALISGDVDSKSLTDPYEVHLYPNPTDGVLNISYSARKGDMSIIQILDMFGRLVYVENVRGTGNKMSLQLDLNDLNIGNYTLRIHNELQSSTERFTVNR